MHQLPDTQLNTHLPVVQVTDEVDVAPGETILLVEWADAATVKHIIEPPSEGATRNERRLNRKRALREAGKVEVRGQRLHRVIHPKEGVLAVLNEVTKVIPLDFMRRPEFSSGAVLASVRPGDPYTWQLTRVDPPAEDSPIMMIKGVRAATPEECERLDADFPKWRERVEAFDAERAAEAAGAISVPPPILSASRPSPPITSTLRRNRPHWTPGTVKRPRRHPPRPRPPAAA